MKKKTFLFVLLSFIFTFGFISCEAEEAVYTINYVTRFGEVPKSIQVSSSEGIAGEQLPELSQQGYIFDGWYIGDQKVTDETVITKDSNLVAKWREIVYVTIDYSTKYGTAPESIKLIKGNTFTESDLPVLQDVDGYEFCGWITDKNTPVKVGEEIVGDMHLNADWARGVCTIIYSSPLGNAPSKLFITKGSELDSSHIPLLTADGNRFLGWFFDGEKIEAGYVVTKDMTLLGKWENAIISENASDADSEPGETSVPIEPEPVIVNYSLNYKQKSSSNKTVGSGYILTSSDLPTPKGQPGYQFTGWYDEIGKKNVKVGDVVLSDMRLVANAKKLSYGSRNWMSAIPDDYPVYKIFGPGTHDSGATKDVSLKTIYKISGADLKYTARCQDTTVSEQLDMGVRFLDVRFNEDDDTLYVYHGNAKQDYSILAFFKAIFDFLKSQPTETVFVNIMTEEVDEVIHKARTLFSGYPDHRQMDEKDLSQSMAFLIKGMRKPKGESLFENFFAKRNDILKGNLGAVRGKIVLIKRYDSEYADRDYGIEISDVEHMSTDWEVTSTYPASQKMSEINSAMQTSMESIAKDTYNYYQNYKPSKKGIFAGKNPFANITLQDCMKYLKYINAAAYELRSLKLAWGLFSVKKIQIPHTHKNDSTFHSGIKNTIKGASKGSLSGFVVVNFIDRSFAKLMYEHNFKDSYQPTW